MKKNEDNSNQTNDEKNNIRRNNVKVQKDLNKSEGIKHFLKWIYNRLKMVFPVALLFVVTFCIYMPTSLFVGNSTEFYISFNQVVPIIIKVALITFISILVIGLMLFPQIVNRIYVALIFGFTFGLYIQGNFLNPDFGQLNGSEIEWDKYLVQKVIGIAVWVVCLIVPLILTFIKKNIARQIIRWVSYGLCAMQLVALVSVILAVPSAKTKTGNVDYTLLRKDEFELSSNENIVYFCIDSLDKKYFEEIIEPDSEYMKYFNDFTYYDNCISGASPTVAAIPLLFTGEMYNDLSVDFSDYQQDAYKKSTLFKDLKDNNYKVKLFTDSGLIYGVNSEEVDNMRGIDKYIITNKKGFTKCLYKFTSFYAMPVALKQRFWFYGEEFDEYSGVEADGYEDYKFDDVRLYDDYKAKGITLNEDSNTFVFYHLRGSHEPYCVNKEMKRANTEDTSLEQQTKGMFKFVTEYMEELKDKGLYDNCTIIISADHGQTDLYQSPAVLIKRKGESKSYTTDSSPVMFTNLRATIASEILDNYSSYGQTLEEVEDKETIRYQTVHMIGRDVYPNDKEINKRAFYRFEFTGKNDDMSKVTPIPWDDKRK